MSKVKVTQKKPTQDSTKRIKLDSIKLKLGRKIYVGDQADKAARKIDSLELEVKKLKMEAKKKK